MTTKKQHYVPRFYLRHFTNNDGKLHAYRRDTGRTFIARPEGVCAKNYLYEVGNGKLDTEKESPELLCNYIEKQLAGAESKLAPLYEQFIACCDNRDFETESFHEGRLVACSLAANLIVRHPRLLERDRLSASELSKIFLATNKLTDHERWMLEQIGVGDRLDIVAEIAIMQTLLFSDHPDVPFTRIYNAFTNKKMSIIQAPAETSFITSSMPVYFLGIDEDNYDFDLAYMPLSYRYAALFTGNKKDRQFIKATIEGAIQYNVALLDGNDVWDVAVANARDTLDTALRELKLLR